MRSMHMRLSRNVGLTAAAVLVLLLTAGARAQEPPASSLDEAGWQGVLGVRAAVSTAQRYVVVLEAPSLADRVQVAGGGASEAGMRGWTATAVAQQEQFLARLSAAGARIAPEYRYAKVLNGFSARLD
ncbi:MAG TPA: hypothetical protein VJ745_00330, partial [Gaiellaceae bacterium]|nr:hypothetical protein [Gaiellaceae bacterium]